MHGFSARDDSGNIIRVIDFIHGKTIADVIHRIDSNHEEYFHNYFPAVLDDYIELGKAIKFLHDHREKHGDIRRDAERMPFVCGFINGNRSPRCKRLLY
jgi:hypothetical protein